MWTNMLTLCKYPKQTYMKVSNQRVVSSQVHFVTSNWDLICTLCLSRSKLYWAWCGPAGSYWSRCRPDVLNYGFLSEHIGKKRTWLQYTFWMLIGKKITNLNNISMTLLMVLGLSGAHLSIRLVCMWFVNPRTTSNSQLL